MTKYVKDNEWGTTFPNFRKEEFMCNHHSVGNGIYYSLLEVMQNLRNKYGSITISSGYRCPSCNASVGGASNSAHLYGGACDFRIDSGWQDNLQNRMNLVTELRNTYNVHYCYCKVDDNRIWNGYDYVWTPCNMGTYIHIDTNEGYYPAEIENFKIEEVGTDYVKVSFSPDNGTFDWAKYSLNKQDWVNLLTNNIIRDLQENTEYRVRLSLRTKDTPCWTESEELVFTTLKPQEEEKHEDSPITPTEPKKPENEPKKEEIEHNTDKKKNILVEFVKFILDLLAKILKKDKK